MWYEKNIFLLIWSLELINPYHKLLHNWHVSSWRPHHPDFEIFDGSRLTQPLNHMEVSICVLSGNSNSTNKNRAYYHTVLWDIQVRDSQTDAGAGSDGNVKGPFHKCGLTLIPGWISNYIPNINYGFKLLIHSQTLTVPWRSIEVWKLINDLISHFKIDVITYPYWKVTACW